MLIGGCETSLSVVIKSKLFFKHAYMQNAEFTFEKYLILTILSTATVNVNVKKNQFMFNYIIGIKKTLFQIKMFPKRINALLNQILFHGI